METREPLRVGETVALRSSPDQWMTVVRDEDEEGHVDCVWMNQGALCAARLPFGALLQAEDEEEPAGPTHEYLALLDASTQAARELEQLRSNHSALHESVERGLATTRKAYPEFDPHEGIVAAVETLARRYETIRDEGNEIIRGLQAKLSAAGLT